MRKVDLDAISAQRLVISSYLFVKVKIIQPDLLIKRVWQDKKQYVAFVVQDLWTFVPWLYKKVEGKEYTA